MNQPRRDRMLEVHAMIEPLTVFPSRRRESLIEPAAGVVVVRARP